MSIIYDPDFDEPIREPAAPVVRTTPGQTVFDAFSGSAAFAIGLVTAFLTLAAIGFLVLLAFVIS